MTQNTTSRIDEASGKRIEVSGHRPVNRDSDVLEQVRHNAVRLLTELPVSPQTLRLRAGDVSVEMEWSEPGQVASVPIATVGPDTEVRPAESVVREASYLAAPTVGTFYRAPEPGADPFVREGDVVATGQQVAIIEAMKLMIPVEAAGPARIVEVVKSDGEPVEYGEPLFVLGPAPGE